MLPHRAFSPPYLKIFLLLISILSMLGAVGWIAENVYSRERFVFERPLMMWVHHQVGGWFEPVAVLLHYLGKPSTAVPLVAVAAVFLYARRYRGYAVFLVLGTLLPTLVMSAAKAFFDRPRPELWPRIVEQGGESFPSGHSTFSAAVALLLWLMLRYTRYGTPAAVFGLVFMLLMGFSRVWLGVHYPTDVFVGWINGGLTVTVLYWLLFRNRMKAV